MWTIDYKKIFWLLPVFLGIEILSFLGFLYPAVNRIALVAIALAVLILALRRLEYGLLALLAELFIGSFGYLFFWSASGREISLRLILWLIIMGVFVLKLIVQARRGQGTYWKNIKHFPLLKYFGLLFLFVLVALINGLARGHALGTIGVDFNAWLFWLLLFPMVAVYGGAALAPEKRNRLLNVLFAAVLWLSLETLALLFVFTHNLSAASDLYTWLRKTLVGEITPTLSGWPRIFIQSQIFPAIALLILWWRQSLSVSVRNFFRGRDLGALILGALFLAVVLISFSRSFWVGLAGTVLVSLVLSAVFFGRQVFIRAAVWLLSAAILGFAIIYLVAIFPYPAPGKFNADFLNRLTNGQEAAITTRWGEIPVLAGAISRNPILGQGFGATVTYISHDPRVLANNPDGLYTTYAFEWGYLDLWLKLGIIGLLIYGFLLYKLIALGLRRGRPGAYLSLGITSGLFFLILTHVFTPYLNHPLGIGFILFGSCLILADRVY